MIEFPLETPRLLIRPLTPDDAAAMHEVWGDPEVMRYIPSGPSGSLEETADRLMRHLARDDGWGLWALVVRESGRVIGCCGLFPVERVGPEIEVAYHIGREHWNQGYATEAARACVEAAFNQLALERVVALAFPDNRASTRVMEKLGMGYEDRVSHYGEQLVKYAISRPAG